MPVCHNFKVGANPNLENYGVIIINNIIIIIITDIIIIVIIIILSVGNQYKL